ncbi:MAG TPA: TolC family protein, partial [Gemmatimonadales bacterium]
MRSAILLGLLALGCASAPAYRYSAVDMPPAFREVTDTARAVPYLVTRPAETTAAEPISTNVSLDYWEQLGDTTLSRLIREVRSANLDVQAARARVNAARSQHTRAALDLTPSATVSGSYARQRLSSASFPGFGAFPDQDVWGASVDPSWELDVFGRIRHNVQAHGALVGVAEEDLRNVQVTLTAEVARAYFVLRGAQEQLEIARRNAENQRHTFDVT